MPAQVTDTCAITGDARVLCKGDFLVRGDPALTAFAKQNPGVRQVGTGLVPAVAGATQLSGQCALVAGGRVSCWDPDGARTFSGVTGATAFASSSLPFARSPHHTCAIIAGGAVMCWGVDDSGALGAGDEVGSPVPGNPPGDVVGPLQARGVSGATSIAVGNFHSCAVDASARVLCWGAGSQGQLGLELRLSRVPVLVPGLTSVRSVVAGSTTTCAALTNGEAWCWGDGDVGQLGNGTERRSATPVRVKGLADVTALAAGGRRFCALRRYGLVSCWGEGAGEAVVERLHQPSTVPVAVPGIAGATSISGSCAFVATVSVLCWGGAGRPTELLKLGDGLMPAPGPGAWVLGKRVVLRSVVLGAAARCPARLTVRADVLGASVSAPATPMSSGGRCRVSLAMVLPERPRATVRVTISTSAGVLRSLKATRFN